MANAKQLEILKQGVEVWNAWRRDLEEVKDTTPVDLSGIDLNDLDLRSANLRSANLSYAILSDSNLSNTDLSVADLSNANLSNANLFNANCFTANLDSADLSNAKFGGTNFRSAIIRNANLHKANLFNANFGSANLNNSNLSSTDVFYTNFSECSLSHTNLKEATFTGVTFANVDLSTARGLEFIYHWGPSSIGIDTLYLSKGKIPEVFLRGCGVPESFITQARALIGAEEGIQFYSCFISYSTQDEEFAQRLHGRLQQDQVRVWYSPHDIQGGRHMHEQIEEAIRVYDKLLILLSPESMASSWVQTELRKARKMERRSGQRKLFPLRLVSHDVVKEWECPDGDSGEDLAVEVRKYFIPDFTQWKDHDAFEEAYKRLLKDLRANEAAKG